MMQNGMGCLECPQHYRSDLQAEQQVEHQNNQQYEGMDTWQRIQARLKAESGQATRTDLSNMDEPQPNSESDALPTRLATPTIYLTVPETSPFNFRNLEGDGNN